MLLLTVLGFLFCLITSYELDLPTTTLVWTAIAFSLLFLAVFSVRKSGLFALVCLALAGVYGVLHAADLLQGILLLIERAITPLSLQLPESMQLLLKPTDMEEAQLLLTHAAQAIVFVVSFLSLSSHQRTRVPGLALSTLPLLLPAPF